jgi:hypothetical protein
MTPKRRVETWVQRFNAGDVDGLAALYAPDAVNHQVVMDTADVRDRIRSCADDLPVENLFDCGDWAMLDWSDPAACAAAASSRCATA